MSVSVGPKPCSLFCFEASLFMSMSVFAVGVGGADRFDPRLHTRFCLKKKKRKLKKSSYFNLTVIVTDEYRVSGCFFLASCLILLRDKSRAWALMFKGTFTLVVLIMEDRKGEKCMMFRTITETNENNRWYLFEQIALRESLLVRYFVTHTNTRVSFPWFKIHNYLM